MSLLLEALKKAEKAKEEAQRQARAEIDGRAGASAQSASAPRHVVTRTELPDISQPLEILSEDLQADPPSRAQALGLEPESGPAAGGAGTQRGEHLRDDAASPRVRERPPTGARMAEPYREPDPRTPFHAALGVLAAVALITVGYFWYQLRPAPGLVNATAPRPATQRPAELASGNAREATAPAELRSAGSALAVPGLPPAPAKEPAAAPLEPIRSAAARAPSSPPAGEQPASSAPPAAPRKPVAPSALPAAGSTAPPATALRETGGRTLKAPARARIHPQVLAAYGAYQAGDLVAARTGYEQVLREEPANRDALLGLAAVEMRAQRFEQSAAYYERLLQVDPRDPHAHAGMLALRGPYVDPVQAESRLKNMLAADPGAEILYFTLGNQYAQQERWADAQQAYFKAYAADSENPDFAFNLAVSLDHLRQTGLALEYYRRALALAQKRAANFAPEIARQRETQLAR